MLCGGSVIRIKKARVLALISIFLMASFPVPVSASTLQLVVAEDKATGYQRSAFKHWIDADKNGCDTRAEVLVLEATVTPKIGSKCKLTGGKWVSTYDGKTITNASLLDVDHMVPLAEAWRSGAWMWSDAEREIYANDLQNSRALISVSASANRAKGDKDPSKWLPAKDKCTYIESWITVKLKYSLTVDNAEASILRSQIANCGIGNLKVVPAAPTPTISFAGFTDWFGGTNFLGRQLLPYLVYIPKISASYEIQMAGLFLRGGQCYDLFDKNNLRDSSKWGNSQPGSGRFTSSDLTVLCFAEPSGKVPNSFYYNILAFSCSVECIVTSPYVNLPELDFALPTPTPTPTPATPIPTPSAKGQVVSPGAFCSPAGATGNSSSGVTYTCKISPTDTRNRWRQ